MQSVKRNMARDSPAMVRVHLCIEGVGISGVRNCVFTVKLLNLGGLFELTTEEHMERSSPAPRWHR